MQLMDYSLDYLSFFLKAMTVVLAIALVSALKQKDKTTPVTFDLINKKRIKQTIANLDKIKSSQNKAKKKELKASLKNVDKLSDNLFVIKFNGDTKASEVKNLREIITSIIEISKPGDKVLLELESPGGEVAAYGLVASQIARLKNKNINVTIAVDKVAASGGYLIASVADSIIAAPFAYIGSIGVISQTPNINKFLKNRDIDVVELTAGKFKRTLTTLGENTKEGKEKAKEQIETIHESFKNHITSHRPDVPIEEVATGEFWLAKDAIELKLIDKIQTSDDFIGNALTKCKVILVQKKSKESKLQCLQKFCETLQQTLFSSKII